MKPTSLVHFVGGILLLGSVGTAFAGESGPFYLHADIGEAFVSSTRTSLLIAGMPPGVVAFRFDPGVRGDLALGYRFSDSWAAEIEAGVIQNNFEDSKDGITQIPVLLNAVYRVPLKHPCKPYFGAGAGAVATMMSGTFNFGGPTIPPLPAVDTVDDTDYTFAYQAMAGLKYEISSHIEVDLGYKFFGTLDHAWQSDNGITLKSDEFYTHAILISFTWKF